MATITKLSNGNVEVADGSEKYTLTGGHNLIRRGAPINSVEVRNIDNFLITTFTVEDIDSVTDSVGNVTVISDVDVLYMKLRNLFFFDLTNGSGGGRITVIPGVSPFVDIAARDAWALANPLELLNSGLQVTMVIVSGAPDEVFIWGGVNQVFTVNTDWLPSTGNLTGSQVVTLIDLEPDSNVVTDVEKAGIFSLNGLTDNVIPLKNSNGTFGNSSLIEFADRIESSKTFVVPPTSLQIGNNILFSDNALEPSFRTIQDGKNFLFPFYEISDTTGSGRPFWKDYGEPLTVPFQSAFSEDLTASVIGFQFPNVASGKGLVFKFRGVSTFDIEVAIHDGTSTAGHEYLTQNIGPLIGLGIDTDVTFEPAIFTEAGKEYFLEFRPVPPATGTFTMQGLTVLGDFLPYVIGIGQIFITRTIPIGFSRVVLSFASDQTPFYEFRSEIFEQISIMTVENDKIELTNARANVYADSASVDEIFIACQDVTSGFFYLNTTISSPSTDPDNVEDLGVFSNLPSVATTVLNIRVLVARSVNMGNPRAFISSLTTYEKER